MENINLDDFLSEGIIKEKDFRKKVSLIDWSKYENQKVIIKGCSRAKVPTWAFLIITANLTKTSELPHWQSLRPPTRIRRPLLEPPGVSSYTC